MRIGDGRTRRSIVVPIDPAGQVSSQSCHFPAAKILVVDCRGYFAEGDAARFAEADIQSCAERPYNLNAQSLAY